MGVLLDSGAKPFKPSLQIAPITTTQLFNILFYDIFPTHSGSSQKSFFWRILFYHCSYNIGFWFPKHDHPIAVFLFWKRLNVQITILYNVFSSIMFSSILFSSSLSSYITLEWTVNFPQNFSNAKTMNLFRSFF